MNQAQWTTESTRSSAVTSPGREQARCRRTFGQLAEPEHAVDADRVADPQPPPQPLRVVVGQLVDDREGPHLQREQRRVARLGAGTQHREGHRAPPRRRPR